MKIKISEPKEDYSCIINTGVMDVTCTEVLDDLSIVTEKGEKLSVSMRDSGFEVRYTGDIGPFGRNVFDTGITIFRDGRVLREVIEKDK